MQINDIQERQILKERERYPDKKDKLLRLVMADKHPREDSRSPEADSNEKQLPFRSAPQREPRFLLVVEHEEEREKIYEGEGGG